MIWKVRRKPPSPVSGVIVIAPLRQGKKSGFLSSRSRQGPAVYCDRISTQSPHGNTWGQWQITVLRDASSA